jgi:hypothetical protein
MVTTERARCLGTKPANKFLMYYSKYIVARRAGAQAGQDCMNFWFILVRVVLKVYSNRIGPK